MAIAVWTSFEQLTTDGLAALDGGSVTVYAAGTTTPLSVYSDPDLAIGHLAANPIVLDSAGRHAMRYISAAAYKTLIKNSGGSTIDTYDNIDPGVPLGTGALAIANGGTGAATAGAALAALGAATAAELAVVTAEVAAVSGAIGSSEKTHIATGTTAQRPASPVNGDFRRNTTSNRWEGYNQVAAWEDIITSSEMPTSFAASQAQQETGSSVAVFVTPGVQQFHASAAKGWVKADFSGGSSASYNVSSITDGGTGLVTVNWGADFSGTEYAVVATPLHASLPLIAVVSAQAAGTTSIQVRNSTTSTAADATALLVVAFGDQ